jgi:hypothetical protein
MSRSELVLFVSALSLEIQLSSGKIGIPLTGLPSHIWGPGDISAISWRPVLVVEDDGVPGGNNRP